MAITIDLTDANNDGKGINFQTYLATYDKKFVADGRGGFNNGQWQGTPMTDGSKMIGSDYVAWDGKTNGQSVFFEGIEDDSWAYTWKGHTVSGEMNAVSFGYGTKEETSGSGTDEITTYTQKSDIRIAFETFTTTFGKSDFVNDLTDGITKSFLKFLNSDSIELNGSSGKDVFTGFNRADTLHGEAGNDKLNGGKGNDIIHGDEGNDVLTGGKGSDTFVFEAGDGKDRITDFGSTDLIDFAGQFANFEAVVDAATESKKGVTIAYDGGSVLLAGLEISDLTEGQFLFA